MKVLLKKSTPKGVLNAPPSKSYSHRYLIGSALAKNICKVENIYYSNDIKATLNCLSSFGCAYKIDNTSVTFIDNTYMSNNPIFNCLESGSTLRFMIPIALTKYNSVTFIGSETLLKRGVSEYEKMFTKIGINVNKFDNGIAIKGKLKPGIYEVDGSMSSQYVTGLLFALPLLNGDSKIILLPPVNSKNYIDMTLDVLKQFGVNIFIDGLVISIPGNQEYKSKNNVVEGDYSNAAFLEAFNYLGGDIKVLGLNETSIQGDRVYKDYFKKLNRGYEEIDISNCIDLGPVLMMFAALKHGAKFVGTKRLKIKESNRALSMKQELEKVGVKLDVFDDEVIVNKCNLHAPNTIFSSHNDHRIAMSLSLLSTLFDIKIDGAEAINKSYPSFYEELKKVGVSIIYETE